MKEKTEIKKKNSSAGPVQDGSWKREKVREHYGKIAESRGGLATGCCNTSSGGSSCCGSGSADGSTETQRAGFGNSAYDANAVEGVPKAAVSSSLGCGNPLGFAEVSKGQTVVDIGSGAGLDALIAARIVGPGGRVIGVDMTPQMLSLARQSAAEAGVENVEFRMGEAENMPVDDSSVDWVISNCVINLSPDKEAVWREIARVLRPGGRVSVSDIVAEGLTEEHRKDMDAWAGCVSGAVSETEYLKTVSQAGLTDIAVSERFDVAGSLLSGSSEKVESIKVVAAKPLAPSRSA